MKYLFFLLLFSIIGCTGSKKVYWCGDHACINKKEKEAYFKKTMTVEIREIGNKKYKTYSEIEKITQQALNKEKKRIKKEKNLVKQARLEEKQKIKELAKEARLEKKRKIKEKKALTKQARLEEKLKIKEKKELTKQVRLEEKLNVKNEKKLEKKKKIATSKKKIVNNTNISAVDTHSKTFKDLVKKITQKNKHRSYPSINDIPN